MNWLTQFPAANAGAIFQPAYMNVAFHEAVPAQTPIGSYLTIL